MLKRLFIKNIALIDEIKIEWGKGFNVLTGETGAGKSITVEALLLILGDRASPELIKEGESRGVVEASFELSNKDRVQSLLSEQALALEDHELVIRREVSSDGKSRAFVNGSQVSISFLKSLGELLVDLHGQHEHQSLLKPVNQREFLDVFGGLLPLRSGVGENYRTLQLLIEKRKSLETSLHDRERQLEYLQFQAKEIKALGLEENEEAKTEEEIRFLSHSEKIQELLKSIDEIVNESSPSLYDLLGKFSETVKSLAVIDTEIDSQVGALDGLRSGLEDVRMTIKKKFGSADYDPERLQYLNDRLLEIKRLKKKYGENLVQILSDVENKISELDKSGSSLQKIEAEIQKHQRVYNEKAAQLTQERKSLGKKLASGTLKELEALGLKGSAFEVRIQEAPPGPSGQDEVLFFISTNPGQSLRPLHEIVSGGELSRVMLAIKTLLARKEFVPVLIFDEIDVNLGGQTAHKVALKLKEVSASHQIIVITHLAQIAAYADHQYYVEKIQINKKVSTHVRQLSSQERTQEIARMLGSVCASSVALTHAQELLSVGQKAY